MKVMIIPNFAKTNSMYCIEKSCEILSNLGVEILMDYSIKDVFYRKYICYGDFDNQLEQSDIIIPVGGDGTIIHTAKHAVLKDKPVLGINAGRIGFLAGLEIDELEKLKDLVLGNYKIENQIMLDIIHKGKGFEHCYKAFNDAVISKGSLSTMIEVDVYCNDRYVISYRADGLILSTPVGSTAYNLSAGGPVVEPNLESIVMTPICPQSLFNRSIIFSSDNILRISLNPNNNSDIFLNIDGEKVIRLQKNDLIIIKRSDIKVNMISVTEKPFYEVLNDKFIKRSK